MRITVFSPDIPYPANRGGRADIWRRLCAFKQLGFETQLFYFHDSTTNDQVDAAARAEIAKIVASQTPLVIDRRVLVSGRRLLWLYRLPWHAARRTPEPAIADAILKRVQAFQPNLIWCEGPWCSQIARKSARLNAVPLFVRSHNIEHLYMAKQATAANSPRDRLAWYLSTVGLKNFEESLLREADWTFDISIDDLAFWKSNGIDRISWMPPLPEAASECTQSPDIAKSGSISTYSADPLSEVLFLGNLRTPNNKRGVSWLVEEVAPWVRRIRPQTRITVAGSNPDDELRALCASSDVRLLPNVPDAVAMYRSARVLVNPVRTGSGTHMKMIEMLMTSASIVSSTQGTRGLPPGIESLVAVADEAEPFARAIVDALNAPAPDLAARRAYCRPFSVAGVRDALNLALPGQGIPVAG